MRNTRIIFALLIGVVLQSCKSVDLRSNALKENEISTAEQQGKHLLEEAKIAMGYDKLQNTAVYEAKTIFDWKGFWLMMPMNTFPGNNKKETIMRFATNTFDGQVEYLEGRKKGTIQGVQSWQGYKTKANNDYVKQHEHDRYIWGLATYHYLLEAPMHLPDAEIIRYAGKKELDGINYETVYVTWGTEAPNKQYDRFLAYIHPETKFIDVLEVTINDYFLPMPKGLQHATARYERKKTSIGTHLPSNVAIQFKGPKKPDNKVYSFKLSDYKFDSFPKENLYRVDGLEFYGFSKPKKDENYNSQNFRPLD